VASLDATLAVPAQRELGLAGARGNISFDSRSGQTICERCTVAASAIARMRGLLGRAGLEQGEGILLLRAPSIHTFFMRFTIDVVFLGRGGEVLKVCDGVKPWRLRSCRNAFAVIELRAGEAARRSIVCGDRLDVGPSDPPDAQRRDRCTGR
jgi:uncharacterized membrane protein (UPF0127 family)